MSNQKNYDAKPYTRASIESCLKKIRLEAPYEEAFRVQVLRQLERHQPLTDQQQHLVRNILDRKGKP